MSNTDRWKPVLREKYYHVNGLGAVIHSYWLDDCGDRCLYNTGNCFATAEEAEEVADTWKRLLNKYHENKNLSGSSSSELMKLLMNAFKNIGGFSDNSETAKLPDWCKVGEWVWSSNSYHKIVRIETNGCSAPVIILDNDHKYTFGSVNWDDVSQARLRPYLPDEMGSLVGRVAHHDTGSYLITAFENRWNQVKIESVWRDAVELMKVWTWLDGDPCGVLEHLEDGEWVE